MSTSEAANSQGHETINVTIEQAQSILRSHLGSDVEVTSLEVLPISGFRCLFLHLSTNEIF